MDHHDDLALEDDEIGAALRRHAGEIAGPVNVGVAFSRVLARSRSRRRWRTVVIAAGTTAAAVVVGGLGLVVLGPDHREVLRSPATQPAPLTAPPSVTVSADPLPATTGSVNVGSTTPATNSFDPTASVAPDLSTSTPTRAPEPQPSDTTAVPVTTRYSSAGGSIVVRVANRQISLDSEPAAVSGWSARIEDNGPTRVRVRFETEERRSEIRVDLVDGVLEPRITEE